LMNADRLNLMRESMLKIARPGAAGAVAAAVMRIARSEED